MQTIDEKVDLSRAASDCDHVSVGVSIRRATREDLDRIVAMGQRFLSDIYAHLLEPPDPVRLRATAAWLLEDDQRATFVSEVQGVLTGMLGIFLHPHPFTGATTASEMFWWVEPEQRGHGVRLYRAAVRWAKDAGATLLQMVAPGPDVARFYEAIGMSKVETSYQRRL